MSPFVIFLTLLTGLGAFGYGIFRVDLGSFISTGEPPADPAASSMTAPATRSTAAAVTPDLLESTATPSALNPLGDPAPPPRAESRWIIRGKAYDLLSLRPVAGALITFMDRHTARRVSVHSGKDGRFSAKLPPLREGGYEVRVRARNYHKNFLDEAEPPYHAQGRQRREEALELFRNSDVLHVPILLTGGQPELEYNVVLAPEF